VQSSLVLIILGNSCTMQVSVVVKSVALATTQSLELMPVIKPCIFNSSPSGSFVAAHFGDLYTGQGGIVTTVGLNS